MTNTNAAESRSALALKRGGVLLLAVLAAACGACDPTAGDVEHDDIELVETPPERPKAPYRRVTYYLDPWPECASTAPGQWEAVGDAFSAWQVFGVEVVESDAPVAASPDVVAVCLRDGEFWSWRSGATVWSAADGMRMDLRIDIDQPDRHRLLWAIAAHEMGHVVLATNRHSPERGGLLSQYTCSACEGFTAGDVEWLESFGVAWEGP